MIKQRHIQLAAATTETPNPTSNKQKASQAKSQAKQNSLVVPRNDQIKDKTPWGLLDVKEVKSALLDAKLAAQRKKIDEHGIVLLGKTNAELEALVEDLGHPKFRANQLKQGIFRGARKISDIKGLSKDLIQKMEEAGVRTGRSRIYDVRIARDRTQKVLLQLFDGRVVEAVGIPTDEADKPRLTCCVSSQVGCPMRCNFCATGKGGFARNLMPYEIVDQVMTIQELFQQRVTNVVYMGMGEPMLNIPAVVRSFEILNNDIQIGARHFTISTVGIPNAIAVLAKFDLQVTLAVSLHAPTQEVREQLVPSAKAYHIDALLRDCQQYFASTGRKVTFEYTMIKDVNDAPEQAEQLAAQIKRYNLQSIINLIPLNPVDDTEYKRPDRDSVKVFEKVLQVNGLQVSVRSTRGLEASAACGQLRNKFQKTPPAEIPPPL